MTVFGVYSDQNEEVSKLINKIELNGIDEDKKDYIDEYENNIRMLRSFQRLINLDKLKVYENKIILGVLVNYARVIDISDRFYIKLPDHLPVNYPKEYRRLACNVIKEMDITINAHDLKCDGWKIPQPRIDAFIKEKRLFLGDIIDYIGR